MRIITNIFKEKIVWIDMSKVIGIFSLKGGVGKTSAVASLGHALSELGKKVLLVDANFSAPNLGLHFNIVDPPSTLHDLLNRKARLKDTICELEHFDVLPSALFPKREIPHLHLKNKINILRKHYDIILIDSPPSLNEESLAPLLASDEILIVTTPDHPALITTLKAIKRAEQRDIKINGLILNKVYNKNFELSMEQIEKATDIPIMAVIPHDVNVMKAVSEFKSSTDHKSNSRASKEYRKLAAVLVGEKYRERKFMELLRKITPSKQEINREIFYHNGSGKRIDVAICVKSYDYVVNIAKYRDSIV